MEKRLLILGAGRGQTGLYRAAKDLGYTVIAGTMPDNNPPCIPMADEVCYMNIANPDEVLNKTLKLKINGVATCCLDTGISALGKLCDSLSLVGLSEEAALMCNDKAKMKKAFIKNNVSTARYYEISNETQLEQALDVIGFPVIIKATDLQGSRGIYICRSKDKAIGSFQRVMEQTHRPHCIVEEYIEGEEFGAQAFIYENEILFIMPHGDNTFMSHTAVPVGHYVPLKLEKDILTQTQNVVESAIKAVGLNNCAVNADLIVRDNKVYVIEITGRVGANCLPELVESKYGIEYYKMIAAMAVGDNPVKFWENRNSYETAALAKMIINTEKDGILERIEYEREKDPDIVEVTFFKHTGDEIRKFVDSNDCIGQMIVKGSDLHECEKKERHVLSQINLVLK